MTQQALDVLLRKYQEDSPASIAYWILNAVKAFKSAYREFPDNIIQTSVVAEPYPKVGGPMFQGSMDGKKTLAMAFTLGFAAGAANDGDMAIAYELLLNVLESLRFHYHFFYGMDTNEALLPYFIVRIPSTPDAYLKIEVLPYAQRPALKVVDDAVMGSS